MEKQAVGWRTKERLDQAETAAQLLVEGTLTSAGANFATAHGELIGFIGFVGQLTEHIDGVLDWIDDGLEKEGEARANKPFQRMLNPYRPLIQELLLSRGVDSYLTYVSELLSLVFRYRPETLRSKETIPIDFVLGFETMDELQDAIAERRVERLAYRGMAELSTWVRETLGFALVTDAARLRLIERLVEQRNLVVHHRGVIDHRYVRKCGTGDGAVGDTLKLGNSAADAALTLAEAVGDADARAAQKWGLERNSRPTPPQLPPFLKRDRLQSA